MSSIRIYLDNRAATNAYHPGQTLTGRVECNFNEDTEIKAILIKFRGRAETEWNEVERYFDHKQKEHRTRDIKHQAQELYFNVQYVLFQGEPNGKLTSGRHVYTFSYRLPNQLPSSFEGHHGNIRYFLRAVADCSWKLNYEDKLVLNVISPLDLNYFPALKEQITKFENKTMRYCCCFGSGELNFSMSIPFTGFIPGQEVRIEAHVDNMTDINVSHVKFKIVKNLEFVTHRPKTKRKFEEVVVTGRAEGGIGAHGEKSWTSTLMIPIDQTFPNLIPCNIMNVTYYLKGTVVVPVPHTNLNATIPVVIGGIPLSEVISTFSGGHPLTQIPFFLLSGAPPTEKTPLLKNFFKQ